MSGTISTIHILHVDDEPDFAEMAATFLERKDERFEVETATTASEGLTRLERSTYDCVISDHDMPGQNGIDFLTEVRDEYPNLPFILYTGKGSEEVASEAISAGVTEYLQKEGGTSQYTVLANRIRNAVEKFHAQTELEDREKRLNLFFEQSPLGVVEWDENFNFVRLNDTAEQILGYSEDEVVGRSWDVIVPNSDHGAVDNVVSDLLEDSGGYRSVNENIRENGERIVCEWHNRVVTDESGDVASIFSQFQDITEENERKAELQRSERRYEAVLNDPNILVGLLDTDGTVLNINETAMEYIEPSLDEIRGRPFWKTPWFAHAEDVQQEVKEWTDRAADGEYVEFEIELVRPNGEPYWIEGVFRPVTNDDGEVVSLLISDRDITERKQREHELEIVQRRFDAVLENTTTPMFMKDDEGEYIFANREYRDLFGLENADVIGRTDDELHPSEVASVVQRNDQAVLEHGEPVEREEVVIVDGEQRVYLTTKVPIYDTGDRADPDEPVAVFGVGTDITERKTREKEIVDREQALQSAYEIIADGDRSVSEQIDALLELGRDHLGTDFATFSHIDDDRYEFERVAVGPDIDLAAGETTGRIELPICDRVFQTGEPLAITDVEAEVPELVDPEWGIECYLGAPVVVTGSTYGTFCFYDVEPRSESFSDWDQTFVELLSDWVGSELTRSETTEQLQRQNERLDEFAGVVRHDLGNPLKVADGRLELARETGESKHFDAAERALDRLDGLIEDLANVMREGQLTNEFTDVDLETVAESCWATLDTAGASVVFEDSRGIRADENALTRLLENVIHNAVDHAGEDVTVRIGVLRDGFYIEDDGSGISEDEREDIFEPGFTTKENGTGFGMVSVRQIALAHGWDMSATESSDGGARFEITGVEFAAE